MAETEIQLKALMVRSLDGDGAAYGALLSLLSGYLRGYFAKRLDSEAPDLEDLVQDTLLAIHLRRSSYDPEKLLTPWVYAMARYKLLDHFRRTGARRTAPIEQADAVFDKANIEEGAVRHDISKLLSKLPQTQRDLIAGVKLGGLSMEEAAQKSGLSVSAVKVRIHRALKALSQTVADEDR